MQSQSIFVFFFVVTSPRPIFADFVFYIRDLPSELPYFYPESSETAAEERHDADRALLRDVFNVIPQVAEERQEEELVEQIALAHRRYVLAAGAEFKKLVFKAKQTIKPTPAPLLPQTAPSPRPPFNRRPTPALRHQSAAPQVRRDQNTNAPITEMKSRRRVGMMHNGAFARGLDEIFRYRVASKV